jgi:hypothetical protein
VITCSPYKTLVEYNKKKKHVNKKVFQSISQEKNIRKVPGNERKLVYRQKNK